MFLKEFITKFEQVIFDLDGVIIDSNTLKVDCIRESLCDFETGVVESFLREFSKSFGQTRVYHFKNFYFNYLKRDVDFDLFYQRYAGRYAELLKERYCNAPICEYADEIIYYLFDNQVKLYVATGTNTTEAETVLKAKRLHHYFDGIFGSPLEKKNIINGLLNEKIPSKEKTIFIGDAVHDFDCAHTNQTPFLFVERYALIELNELTQRSSFPFYAASSLSFSENIRSF